MKNLFHFCNDLFLEALGASRGFVCVLFLVPRFATDGALDVAAVVHAQFAGAPAMVKVLIF